MAERLEGDAFVDWLCTHSFSAVGKQILFDKIHIADANDEFAAQFIADSLAYTVGHDDDLFQYLSKRMEAANG